MTDKRLRQLTIIHLSDTHFGRNHRFNPPTARKVVTDLVAEGKVEEVGTAKGRKGPGRAPTAYKRARK